MVAGLRWQDALDLTIRQAAALFAAADRSRAKDELMLIRVVSLGTSIAHSKYPSREYSRIEKPLLAAASKYQ